MYARTRYYFAPIHYIQESVSLRMGFYVFRHYFPASPYSASHIRVCIHQYRKQKMCWFRFFLLLLLLSLSSYLVCVLKIQHELHRMNRFLSALYWFQLIHVRWVSFVSSELSVTHIHIYIHIYMRTRPHTPYTHMQSHTLHISYFDPVTIFADFQSCFSTLNYNHRDDSSFSFIFSLTKNRKPSVQRETKIFN